MDMKPAGGWAARRMQRMARRTSATAWAKLFKRGWATATRHTVRAGAQAMSRALRPTSNQRRPPPGAGDWIPGVAMGAAWARRFRLYRCPPDLQPGERLPLLVMLHGCGQDAKSFAASTRMNRIAVRERFLVLYPEQDRLANAQGCWNWFDTRSGRAQGEAALILSAIDQVCLLHPVDRTRVAAVGMSAGASMAALLVSVQPGRFKALAMHSGIPPGTAHSGLSALSAMHGRRGTPPLPATAADMSGHWPPLLVIHGGADSVVAANNGRAAVQAWADAAGARAGTARDVQRGKRYAMTVTDFTRRGSTVARFVDIGRLGHAWSGGAAKQPYSDARGPDASRMVWAFAARQFALLSDQKAVKSDPA